MNTEERMQQVLGEDAQQYAALRNKSTYKEAHFAESSKFYEQIMADGEIFNPYIHRRWLPGQYAHIVGCVKIGCPKYNTMEEYFKWMYDTKYCVKYATSEIYKLYILRSYSKKAYTERSQFFTIEILREILKLWVDDVAGRLFSRIDIDKNNNMSLSSYYIICEAPVFGRYNYVNVIKNGEFVRKLKYSYDDLLNRLKEVSQQLEIVNNIFDLKRIVDKLMGGGSCEIPYPFKDSFRVPDSFYEAFWKSGAYYSIKSKIMTSENPNAGSDLKDLRQLLDNGTTAKEFHEIYLKMMKEEE